MTRAQRTFNNQREAIIAALQELGRPANTKEVSDYVTTNFGITIGACSTVMADMEVNGKSTIPANEKILLRKGRGIYDLKTRK